MPLPACLEGRLRLPVVAAPMFLVSGPELVTACCRAGIVGTFPALNPRSTEDLAAWLDTMAQSLGPNDAPFGVNLIVHRSNPRLEADLALVTARKVPVVITSLGAAGEVVNAVHDSGGVVFHDVVSLRHAEKAMEAGVDGLVLVCAGAGGHAGTLNPFAFLHEVRHVLKFPGTLLLAGGLSTAAHVAAARMMGADLAYLGTRFIATQESLAPEAYKAMLLRARAADVVYTPGVSGIPANFLKESLEAAGLDPATLSPSPTPEVKKQAWRDVWSAGQGVGAVNRLQTVAEVVAELAVV